MGTIDITTTKQTKPVPGHFSWDIMYILANHLHSIFSPNRACHPGSHCWNYYHGAQSFKSNHCNSFEDRVPVGYHLQVPYLQMSCSDLTRMRGYQDDNPSNYHQGTCLIIPATKTTPTFYHHKINSMKMQNRYSTKWNFIYMNYQILNNFQFSGRSLTNSNY